jgi:hypothetical protein
MVTWVVGAVINVCGSILINGGTVSIPLKVLLSAVCKIGKFGRVLLSALRIFIIALQNVMKLGHDKRTAIQADAAETGAAVPSIRCAVRPWTPEHQMASGHGNLKQQSGLQTIFWHIAGKFEPGRLESRCSLLAT